MPHLCLRFRLRGGSGSASLRSRSSGSSAASSDKSESVYLDITTSQPSNCSKYQNTGRFKCTGWRVIRTTGEGEEDSDKEFAMICDIEIPRDTTTPSSGEAMNDDDDDEKTEGMLDGDSVFGGTTAAQ